MIRIQQAAFGHKGKALLTAEDLHLVRGQVYALIGKNGAGKSTFLNTLTLTVNLIRGNIFFNDKPVLSFARHELAKTVAFVESKVGEVEFIKVRDFVALGRSPYTGVFGRLSGADDDAVENALRSLGLGDFSHRYLNHLSDGERQLVAIARALAQDTPIILLDEPTAFLDYGNRKKLIEILFFLAKNENKCIIFSCHDIDLCLEENIPVLLITSERKELVVMNQPTRKALLELAF